jgi:energy-coupling factor transporter transmembrane protein EcfT
MDVLNAVGNWILPINCNWFILFIILGAIGTIAAWVWTYQNSSHWDNEKKVMVKHPVKTFLRSGVSVVVTAIALSFVVWIIYASNRPVEVDYEEKLEIKPVTYPNGRVVQMFSCNGTNYNANQMFSSAPPAGSYVRRLIYKRVYVGVYFPPMDKSNSSLNDGFFLVTPDKNERPADAIVPDKQ